MRTWSKRLLKGTTAAVAAIWLFAAPQAAMAQWWEDEDTFYEDEGMFDDYGYYDEYGYYDDYGLYDEDVALGTEEYYDEMEEYTDEMDDTPFVTEREEDRYNELEERSDWAGVYGTDYYDEDFYAEDWNDWWF